MPRGYPKSGVRKFNHPRFAKKMMAATNPDLMMQNLGQVAKAFAISGVPMDVEQNETDEEIEARLDERFTVLDDFTDLAAQGEIRALIVSGPPGLGKSFTVEKALERNDPNRLNHEIVKGYVRPQALFKLLWKYKDEGQVLVFDDADSIFYDDNALNLLKAACDTTETRRISYMTADQLIDDDSNTIEKQFEFNGTIIFITNFNFDRAIESGHSKAEHFAALMSRAHYIDLALNSRRDYLVQIRRVARQGLLDAKLTRTEADDVLRYIEDNTDNLRELSLRMALKLADLRKTSPDRWQARAKITCCKNR